MNMKKQGFASMYIIYSFFLIFILMVSSTLMLNKYKKTFLNTLKNDIKEEIETYSLENVFLKTEESKENPR